MPDHCKDTVCANGGVCVDGNCSCLNGYEGMNCEEVWNTKLLGNWMSTEEDGSKVAQYPIALLDNGRPDQFLVMNLGNQFDSIVCKRESPTEFTFSENQKIDTLRSIDSGSGIMDTIGKTISVSYTLKLKDTAITYNAAWSK